MSFQDKERTPTNQQNRILVHPFFQTKKIKIKGQKTPATARCNQKPTLEDILYSMRKTQQNKFQQYSPIKYHTRLFQNKIIQASKKSPQDSDAVKINKTNLQSVSTPRSNKLDLKTSFSSDNRIKSNFRYSIRKNPKFRKTGEMKLDPAQLMKPCIISAMPIKSRPLTSGEKFRPLKLESQEGNYSKILFQRKVRNSVSMQQQLLLPLSPWISDFTD